MTLASKIGDTRWLLTQPAWTGNTKTIRRTPGVLADLTIRQFWSVRATQLHLRDDSDALRTSCSWRRGNDPGIGERVRRTGPYLARANAPRS